MLMTDIIKALRHTLHPLRVRYERFLGVHFPKRLADIRYREWHSTGIDWKHPRNIDEKINWMKYYGDTSLWPLLADKYRVRQYVEERGLGDMLVPLYGKWDHAEDIEWDSLPNQFVMKTNHGSKSNFICYDKQRLDIPAQICQFNEWLHTDYSVIHGETHYRLIKPCIIAEQLLDVKKQPVESSSLIDYKIWAFDGEPLYIWCCMNRTSESVEVITYDTKWNAHPEFSVSIPHYILTDKRLPRPLSLDKMLKAAAILSKGHPQVRVDFYEVDGKPYFGEMTFTSSSGVNCFYTESFLLELGRHAKLPID